MSEEDKKEIKVEESTEKDGEYKPVVIGVKKPEKKEIKPVKKYFKVYVCDDREKAAAGEAFKSHVEIKKGFTKEEVIKATNGAFKAFEVDKSYKVRK